MIRRFFHRNQEFVAVKTFRYDAATLLQPGDPLPEGTRTFHKQSLFRRRLIGAKDDPWTLAQIPKAVAVPVAASAPSEDDPDDDDYDPTEDDLLSDPISPEDDPDADDEKFEAEDESEDE